MYGCERKMTQSFVVFSVLLLATVKSKTENMDRDEMKPMYGDLGDEIYTNYPIRKSIIPGSKSLLHHETGNLQTNSSKEPETETNGAKMETKKIVLNPFGHFINPVFYRDFIAVKQEKPRHHELVKKSNIISKEVSKTDLKYKPMTAREIIALNDLKKIIEPSSVHIKTATRKSNILEPSFVSRDHAIYIAKSLRSPRVQSTGPKRLTRLSKWTRIPFERWIRSPSTLLFTSPLKIVKNSNYRGDWLQPNIATASIPRRLYNGRSIPSLYSKQLAMAIPLKSAEKSNTMFSSWKNSFFRNTVPGEKISFSERKRIWRPYNTSKKIKLDRQTENLLKKSQKYNNNSLLNDLAKVTMKWTGYKELSKLKGSKPPKWLRFLKSAMQPKAPIREASTKLKKKLRKTPNLQQQQQVLSKSKAHDQKAPEKGGDIQKETSTDLDSGQPLLGNKRMNTTSDKNTAKKEQFTIMESGSITIGAPQQIQSYASTFPVPGVIPWNYYHSEKLPDGRIRPALYPIANHIPAGKCLPENSICDKGHSEQCCGATTFCVDYWGMNKCLAFRRMSTSDLHDPYQIRNNLNYKSYHQYLTSSIQG